MKDDIIRLLRANGFRLNETIVYAIDELIDVIQEENDTMQLEDDDSSDGDSEEH